MFFFLILINRIGQRFQERITPLTSIISTRSILLFITEANHFWQLTFLIPKKIDEQVTLIAVCNIHDFQSIIELI